MVEPLSPALLIDPAELEALQRDAERYRWLRTHAVRVQGSDIWYAGQALDIRVDVGRDHVAEQAQSARPTKTPPRKR